MILLLVLNTPAFRMLKERTDVVEEILTTASSKLTVLRQLLRGLPDLARGLCRIQYGKVRCSLRYFSVSEFNQSSWIRQCTPQELAMLLPAFNKIATTFDPVGSPSEGGFRSPILNDVIYTMPKLREPIQSLLRVFSLKAAAEGKKDSMWTDPDKFPDLDGILAVGPPLLHPLL